EVRSAFLERYVDDATGSITDPEPAGSHLASRRFAPVLAPETQTGYVLPLVFSMLDAARAERAGRRLVGLVEDAGRRLATGFCGSAFLPAALELAGRADLAYELLLRREQPSLGFMAEMGATSVWERWDGLGASGWPACPTMNSFNHYAMSSMLSWLVEGVCGLRPVPDAPGFVAFEFRPALSRRLEHAALRYDSAAGPLALSWEWDGPDRVIASLDVPAGSSCELATALTVDERPARARLARVSGEPAADRPSGGAPHDERALAVRLGRGRHEARYELS
ncbi:MAG TPA: alpha-L-rhamnosidase C-terminal domain-containing protein, partial [Acidimicrobiales bacterium]|nr:alpha-L-rhamnosidase C-terminal domain-containing protein [Acidimicrobiales bacterium]